MTGIVSLFILLNEASMHTFLDLASNLVDLVFRGGVWTQSYHRPFKLWFDFEVILDQFFAKHKCVNAPKTTWYFGMSLFGRESRFKLYTFSASQTLIPW